MADDFKVGSVSADITLDTTDLEKGVKTAEKDLNQLSKSFQQASKNINTHLVAINKSVNENTNSVTSQTKKLQNSFKVLNDSMASNTVTTTKAINKMRADVVKELQKLSKEFANLQKATNKDFTTGLNKLATASAKNTKTVVSNLQAIQKQAEATNKALASGANVKTPTSKQSTTPTRNTNLAGSMDGAAKSASSFFGSLSSSWQMISKISFQAFILEQSFQMIAGTVQSLVAPGFQFASSMETMRIGMAGILASTTEINGQQTSYAQGLQISEQILKRMQIEAMRTTLTVSELSEAYQSALAGGLNAGMDLNQIMDLVVASANAVKSFGLPKQQVIQEIRGLISGDAIRPGVDMMATVLGYTTATVNKLREEGTLYEDIRKRMAGFEAASYDLSTTWEGMLNNFADGVNKIASVAVENLYQNTKSKLKEITDMLFTLQKEDFTYTDSNGQQQTREVVTDINLNQQTLSTMTKFYNTLSNLLDLIWTIGKTAMPAFNAAFNGALNVINILVVTLNGALTMLQPLISIISNAATEMYNFIASFSDTSIGRFVSEYGALLAVIATTSAIVVTAKNGVASLVSEFVNLTSTVSGAKSISAVSTVLGSLATEWTKLGKIIGLSSSFSQAISMMVASTARFLNTTIAGRIATTAWGAAVTVFNGIMATGRTLVGLFTGQVTLSTAAQTAASGATAIWSGITNTLSIGLKNAAKQVALLVARIAAFLVASAATVASIAAIVAAIGTVVYAVYKVSDASSALGKKWNSLWNAIGLEVDLAKKKIEQFWYSLTDKDAANAMQGEINTLTNAVNNAWNAYDSTTMGDIMDEFVADAKAAANKVKDTLNPDNLMKDFADSSLLPDNIKALFTAGDSADAGSAGKGAGKLAKSAYKALEAELKLALTSLKEQQKALDSAYKNDLKSTQDYIEQSMALAKQQLDEEIANYEKRKEIAQSLGQTSDVEQFDNKIAEARQKAMNLEAEYTRKLIEEYKKLDDRLDEINKKYQDIAGESRQAFEQNLIREFAGDYSRLLAEMTTAQERYAQAVESGKQAEINAWKIRKDALEGTIDNLEDIIRLRNLEQQAQTAASQVERINLDVQEQYISKKNQANRLAYTEADAEGDLFDFRKEHMDEYIDAYTDMIALYTKMAQVAEQSDNLTQANNFRQQALDAKQALLELTDAVPPFQRVIKEEFIGSLSDAFQSMLWGEKTAKEALQDFAKSVLQTWSKKIFDRMATNITDSLFSAILPSNEQVGNREVEIDSTVQSKLKIIDVDSKEFQDKFKQASLDFQNAIVNTAIPPIRQLGDVVTQAAQKIGGAVGIQVSDTTGGTTTSLGGGTTTTVTGGFTNTGYNMGRGSSTTVNGVNGSMQLDNDFLELGDVVTATGEKMTSLGSAVKFGDTAQTGYNYANEIAAANAISMGAALIGASANSEKLSNAMMILMAVMQVWQMWMQMQAAQAKASSAGGIWGALGLAADGGYISGPGTSTSDSIPMRLSDGEYVIRAKAVRALGTDFLDRLNAAGSGLSGKGKLPKFRYAEGGYVTADTSADPVNNSGAVGGQPIQLVMNNNFQSVDPKANMDMWKQQYPMIRSQIIKDLQTNSSMRNAAKGATK
jgi:hypothetical protein